MIMKRAHDTLLGSLDAPQLAEVALGNRANRTGGRRWTRNPYLSKPIQKSATSSAPDSDAAKASGLLLKPWRAAFGLSWPAACDITREEQLALEAERWKAEQQKAALKPAHLDFFDTGADDDDDPDDDASDSDDADDHGDDDDADDDNEVTPKTTRTTKRGKPSKRGYRRAKTVSRSPETWRFLRHYPLYEISSHGRVRALNRAKRDDWLKPRWGWKRGVPTPSVVLIDKDGKRRERNVPMPLISVGFLKKPRWMEEN